MDDHYKPRLRTFSLIKVLYVLFGGITGFALLLWISLPLLDLGLIRVVAIGLQILFGSLILGGVWYGFLRVLLQEKVIIPGPFEGGFLVVSRRDGRGYAFYACTVFYLLMLGGITGCLLALAGDLLL